MIFFAVNVVVNLMNRDLILTKQKFKIVHFLWVGVMQCSVDDVDDDGIRYVRWGNAVYSLLTVVDHVVL